MAGRRHENSSRIVVLSKNERGERFCGNLVFTLQSYLPPVDRTCIETAKYRTLKTFHSVHLTQLPGLWVTLFFDISLDRISPLLLQTVNRRMFEDLMIEHFKDCLTGAAWSGDFTQVATPLNAEQENGLCCVTGYVALKLMRKYEKEKKSERTTQFVEFLSNMAIR